MSSLNVSSELRELFEYITRFTPTEIELDTKLKPFIPEYIPSVGDIDAFIKVNPPIHVSAILICSFRFHGLTRKQTTSALTCWMNLLLNNQSPQVCYRISGRGKALWAVFTVHRPLA